MHWACDTWGDPRTRWIGPNLIRWFRNHHDDPASILGLDAIEVDGPAALAAAPALGLLALPPLWSGLAGLPGLHAFLVSLVCVSAAANHLHAWAHTPSPPPAVAWLQRRGWILSRHQPRPPPPAAAKPITTASPWAG